MTTKASAVCRRGLAIAGRRCRTAAPVAWPLVQRGLDARSEQAAWPSPARAYSRSAGTVAGVTPPPADAADAAAAAGGAAVSVSLRPFLRGAATGNRNSGRGGGGGGLQASRALSTSVDAGDASTEDAGAPAGAGADGERAGDGNGADSQEGDAGESEAASPQEENPLEGLVQDDGDPGPPPPLDPSIVTEPSPKVLEVMESIDALNFAEIAMLIDVFKNKLGLDELPTLSTGGSDGEPEGGGDGGAPAADAKKTIFKVKVTGFGDKAKIKVIKEVRVVTGLGLREAKEMVENLPQV
ncbi:unnamed protein product, partial [Hapterophycus canaliculatus]